MTESTPVGMSAKGIINAEIEAEMERIEQAWNALTPEQRQAFIDKETLRLAEINRIMAQHRINISPTPDDDDDPFG